MAVDTTGGVWHKRFWHMSDKGMQKLTEDNLILKMKNVQVDKCLDLLLFQGERRTSVEVSESTIIRERPSQSRHFCRLNKNNYRY